MLVIGIIITILIGFLAVNVISIHFTWSEKIGFSFPLGIGLQTMAMLLINMIGFKLTPITLFVGSALLLILLFISLYRRQAEIVSFYRTSIRLDLSGYNLVWIFLVAVIAYLEYMNFTKCMYFPTFDRDSLAGFDTIGYVIAQEHTFRGISLFQESNIPNIHGPGSYITYAPMVQLSYAFVYILGAETSKLIPGLMFLFFLIAFYGAVQRTVGKTGAALATLFMMVTPEMIAFSSLSATNVIHAVSASLGVIYIALWFKVRRQQDLYLGAVFLALNIWTRTDGIVFIGAAFCIVLVDTLKSKQWRNMLPIIASFLPALIWVIFSKINNFYAESIAILHFFWDETKAETIWQYMVSHYMNTLYYGWTFVVFLFSLVANAWFLFRKKDNLSILSLIVVSSLFYIILIYQIDYKWDKIENVLAFSAKRFMFCFVPCLWFFSFSNYIVSLILKRIDKWLEIK